MKIWLIMAVVVGLFLALTVCVADETRGGAIVASSDVEAQPYGNWFAHDKKPTVGMWVKCPVMVGKFKVKESTSFSKYKGKWYAFCCEECKTKFDADPEKYLQACPPDCPCED